MIDNIFTSFLITVITYVLPMLIVRISGPLSKKKAHNFALGNSIIVALIFMILRMGNDISVGSFSPAILYYFINRSILNFGFNGEETINTKGAGVFTLKDNNGGAESKFKNDIEYKRIYQSLDIDIRKLVFQGGFDDFTSMFQTMKYLLGNEYSSMELINIYVDIWMSLESNEPNEVINLIQSKYEYKNISEKASILISFVVNHKKDNSFKLVSDEIHSTTEEVLEKNISNEGIKNEDYRKQFESLDPNLSLYIFPGGYNEFKIIINSLKYLLGKKYTIIELVKMYALNWTRTGQSDADEVVKKIKISNELEDDVDKIDLLVSFILIHKNNTDFEIKNNENFTIVKMLADSFKERTKFKEINDIKITQNIHDDDYGKVVNKPIYINGFKRSDKFMKNLRFENGDSLKYDRKGSIQSDGGNVDVYEIENDNTHEKDILYINLYSNNSEYYPPKGYRLVSNEDTDIKYNNKEQVSKNDNNNMQTKSENIEPHIEIKKQEHNEVNEKTCLKCNHKNPTGSKFCSKCGSELLIETLCEKCGSRITDNANYCNSCGSKI